MMKGNQPLEPPVAQSYKRKLGEFELVALSDGGLNYPTAMILGNVPPEGASGSRLERAICTVSNTAVSGLLAQASDLTTDSGCQVSRREGNDPIRRTR